MPVHVTSPVVVPGVGDKVIRELVGNASTGTGAVSVARMISPSGWVEPGQTPEFDEYTVVLKGALRVETKTGVIDVKEGEAVIAHRGEWIRYSSPGPAGAEYIAVCIPAFSPETVHRDS